VILLEDVTAQHIRAYLVAKQTTTKRREASGNYSHSIARAIRAFFNFCVNDGLLDASPMAGVKMPRRPKKILDVFSSNDIKKLTRAASNGFFRHFDDPFVHGQSSSEHSTAK
jgi:integrase/recombinase XerD